MGEDEDLRDFLQALERLEEPVQASEGNAETAVLSLNDVFDLSTPFPTPPEVARIREAARARKVFIDLNSHADRRMKQRGFSADDVIYVLEQGKAVEKDIWVREGDDPTGISFVGGQRVERRLKVKVSWDRDYFCVTVHPVK